MRYRVPPRCPERRTARPDNGWNLAVLVAEHLAVSAEQREPDQAVIEDPVRIAGQRKSGREPARQPPHPFASGDVDQAGDGMLPSHIVRYRLGDDPRPPHYHPL